ncbi:S8 family peptidase [Streptomyces zagrosensis]|uniref:Subtilisin family serine protease n=1 Tax=Streptomyces zagrosensis TaxID=1042984 RepID=A0A7W9Q7Y7_9ACTN|nr:S8 family serine peptidase [Streptomyces zagrosensis]MBB5934222.1 subtilisin family serine protease [Streptomyces zagrosensis]
MTTPIAVAQENPAASTAVKHAGKQHKAADARTWITLITGDRVAVDAKGRPASIQPAKGREHIPVQVERRGGHVYTIPLDARRLIAQGTVDKRLFDITTLSKPEYVASQREGLRLIVSYRGDHPAARGELRAAEGTELRRTLPVINADAVTTPPEHTQAAWEALTNASRNITHRTAASGVATVWLDGIRKATLDKSVPQIGAPAAWKAGYDGKGTKIAVLDTGVDQTHPDLAGQQVAEKNFTGSPDTKDRVGHGTHVASTAAGTGKKSGGKYRGVASGAKILDGKVLDDEGSGEDSGIIAGLEWAAAQKADVVNLSLGGFDEPGLDPLEAAVNKLSAENGILFAISAGNSGELGSGTVGSPGSAEAALTVGAVDKKDKLAEFSSKGPRVGDGAIKPDVTAPGVDIGAAAAPGSLIAEEGTPVADGYVAISGTSMSAPHAAGAGAILAQQHPDWTGARIKAALIGSTIPGKYTAFEQGSGRIDLRKAITQSVVAEPASLSFDKQQWPHADDKPQSKELTYRNLGSTPVTVEVSLTATDPKGKPAPSGFFTVKDKRLTVPANGTASTSVSADTRLGGTVDGSYSAHVTATAGGQTVRTAAAVEREVESYEVTLKHLGRDGKPAQSFDSSLFGVSGLATGQYANVDETIKDGKVRVPAGRYLLSGTIEVGANGYDWLNQPKLVVGKNTTVTLDARTAKPIDVTVPDRGAASQFAFTQVDVLRGTAGTGWILDSFKNLRTAHIGPAVPAGELSQQFTNTFQRDEKSPAYHVAYGGPTTKAATGFVRHAKTADLAKVTATLGASVPNKTGYLYTYPLIGDMGSLVIGTPTKLPHTATLYVNGKGPRWLLELEQDNTEGELDAYYSTDELRFTPGKSYSQQLNVGVFGPKLGATDGIFREGNEIVGALPLFADGKNNSGASTYDKVQTTLYRNGKKVGSNADPLTGNGVFKVPAGAAKYKLSTSVSRSKVAGVSTKITSSWAFSSKKTTGEVKLPASVVRFSPALAADSTSKAGATVKVPVLVQGSAAGKNLKSLAVYVSYDNGAHWKKLTVSAGKVSVKNPGAGKSVSFKADATDKQGNTVSQAIHHAYRTR